MNELNMPHHDSLHLAASSKDAQHLLAEMELVFAEVVAGAETRRKLTDKQRGQSQLAIEAAMESVRGMMERLAVAKPRRNELP